MNFALLEIRHINLQKKTNQEGTTGREKTRNMQSSCCQCFFFYPFFFFKFRSKMKQVLKRVRRYLRGYFICF